MNNITWEPDTGTSDRTHPDHDSGAYSPPGRQSRAAAVRQFTKILNEFPDLARVITGNDQHNSMRDRIIRYAAEAGGGYDRQFIAALNARGGASAVAELRERELEHINAGRLIR